jgi:hypothetical protein
MNTMRREDFSGVNFLFISYAISMWCRRDAKSVSDTSRSKSASKNGAITTPHN